MKKIFFPGSFNPFTKGHADILRRLLNMAERVTIGLGVNPDKPFSLETAETNAGTIKAYLDREGLSARVDVVTYAGLTALEARRQGASCMARGVRNATDFDAEYALASANREAFGIETILIPADPALSFVSSSMIRDLKANGEDSLANNFTV